ncbi:glycosyltransferase family 4 protein [Mucilaginibacter xinganensis]|uniref:Uncharacterized protein n=1 Tax=Mucilaginibacter xinganensis TaxID=1234841 RepID=A0A223NZB2_9SPHI|nr:glycosyltransferase family 4 protein [Mucilaginibacter xinganensis]ASU35166.1 hypothetical protein MuYL_3281 [Mucilaginibacter xinganensis]
MNILYLCDEYPPGKHGGIGTYVSLIARQMVKLGHSVTVAGLYSPGYGGEDEFEDEGVKVYRFRRGFDYKLFGNETSFLARIGIRLLKDSGLMDRDIKKNLLSYKNKLEALISSHHIDIIEMPDYNDYIRFCNIYIPFPKLPVPIVIKLNGSLTYFAQEAGKSLPAHVKEMEQAIFEQAAAISSASKYTAEKTTACFSYPNKISVIYNGIATDLPYRNLPKKEQQVIFTGTLVEKKGIYQLAKAWNIVNKNMPDARLMILGKGSSQEVSSYLSNEAKGSVSFLGHVAAGKLYEYLSASVVSVFPSYAEAFSLAPLEAMACRTAVINSNRSSGPELVDDRINGLLVNPDDVDQIASAIIYLLKNPDVCERLARAGNEKVQDQFEITKIAAKTILFYGEVLNKKE